MKSLVGVSKWSQNATKGIELNLGDIVLGDVVGGVILDRITPNMLIAGSEGYLQDGMLGQIIAFAMKRYDPNYFSLVVFYGNSDDKHTVLNVAQAKKRCKLFEGCYNSFCCFIEKEIEDRINAMSVVGCMSIENFNNKTSSYMKPMPRMMVVVNDYDKIENMERLISIMRRSAFVGIHFIFTSEGMNDLLNSDDFMRMFPIKVCTRSTEEISNSVIGSDDASKIKALQGFCYSKIYNELTLWHYHNIRDNDLINLYREM